MRMRQSLAEIERAFVEEAIDSQARSEEAIRAATQRQHARTRERRHKHGTMRFWMLTLVLIATAVLVTVAMFETLYLVMS
jgi:hypothetical protein